MARWPRPLGMPATGMPRQHLLAQQDVARFLFVCLLAFLIVLASFWSFGDLSELEKPPSAPAACGRSHVGPGTLTPFHEQRRILYSKMEEELAIKGALFLKADSIVSQGLKLSELFTVKKGTVSPILKPAKFPVRTTLLRLDSGTANSIHVAIRNKLTAHFPNGVWFQPPELYHVSLYQASTHKHPIPSNRKQVEDEVRAVKGVARRSCALRISLDRIVLTSSGVLMGCWQVLEGTDPAELRKSLQEALPHSPKDQLYNRFILHTTLARLLTPPVWPDKTLASTSEKALPMLRSIVNDLSQRLCTTQTVVRELWYAEELDALALALQGQLRPRKFNLSCLHPDWIGVV